MNTQRFYIILIALLFNNPLMHAMISGNHAYHSAGITPYAIDAQNKKWLLMGLEPYRNGQAFDFGGKKDPEDQNNSRYTAAREGTEELLFLLDNTNNFNRIVGIYNKHPRDFTLYKSNSTTYNFLREAMKNSLSSIARGYVTYFVKIDYNPNIPQNFITRRKSQKVPGSWIEKNQLVWLPLNEIIDALYKSCDDNSVYVRGIKLFPHVALSLRTALNNGIFEQLH